MASPHETIVAETFLAPVGTPFRTGDCEIIERPGWYQIITPSVGHPGRNGVIYSVVNEDIDRVIDETCAQYERVDVPFKWCLGPLTRPQNMAGRLIARGFVATPLRGMYCDPARLSLTIPDDVIVCRAGAEQLSDYLDAFFRGWEIATTERKQLRSDIEWASAQPEWHFFVARIGDEIAASASLFVKAKSGYLMGANVLPAFRSRGIYRCLLRKRLDTLRQLGSPLATIQAREATAAPILERLGFTTAYRGHMMLSPHSRAYK